jgi:hypothetical protein
MHIFFNDATNAQSSTSFEGSPIVGAKVHWCLRLDLNCAQPSADVITDNAGIARFNVPGGFDGYYELRGTGFSPFIFALPPQFVGETFQGGIVDGKTMTLAGQLVGIEQNATLSQAVVSAVDCNSIAAPGVVFDIKGGPNARLVYLSNSLPSLAATQSDETGSAFVFNVSPGTFEVTSTLIDGSKFIRKGTSLTRSGWVTFMQHYGARSKRRPPR